MSEEFNVDGPINVLLVEDNPADATFVEVHLGHSALDFSLTCEESLLAAVQRLKHAKIDVILLDLSLPDSHGLETFTRIHGRALDVPIVILSGHEDSELAVAAVAEGAQDYLTKGKLDGESLTRSIRYAIERSRRQHAERELSAAGVIQRQLLPKVPPRLPGFDISGRCEPATFAGGDYFDFFPMRSNRLGIAVADVAGHGVGPALMMSETRAILRTLAPITNNVGDILTRANRVLAADLVGSAFVSVFLACLDWEQKTFEFGSAGHPGFVLDESGKIKRLLKTANPPLGVQPKLTYASSPAIPLERHEALFVYTDGIVECVDSSGTPWGKKHLFETVRETYEHNASQVIAKIFAAAERFCDRTSPDDDMTAILIKARADIPASDSPVDAPPAAVVKSSYKHIEVETIDGTVLLRLVDRSILDSQVCRHLQDELLEFLTTTEPARVVISFRTVERLASETISALLKAREAIVAKQGSLRLCEISPVIREAFAALNLDGTVFFIDDDEETALRSF